MERKRKFIYNQSIIKTLGDSCGYDANTAFAELLDNSIGAGASEILISYNEEDETVTVKDDGDGMNADVLEHNFFAGGYSTTKDNQELSGKFGLGGKAAIMYLMGEKTGVITITTGNVNNSEHIYAEWELIPQNNGWDTGWDFMPYEGTFNGTEITFPLGKEVDFYDLQSFIQVTYYGKMENDGISIKMQTSSSKLVPEELEPEDPLYRDNDYAKNHNMIGKKKWFNVPILDPSGNRTTKRVGVTISRFHSNIPEQYLTSFDRGPFKKGKLKTNNRSGIFIRTTNRYYSLGGNITKLTEYDAKAQFNGFRAEIDVPKYFWPKMGMTWNKGDKLINLSKIKEFNTGDPETGVYDYIKEELDKYVDEEQAGALDRSICKESKIGEELKSMGFENVSCDIINKEVTDGKFVSLNGNKVIFNRNYLNKRFKEKGVLKGIIIATMIQVDGLLSQDKISEINNIINNLNF